MIHSKVWRAAGAALVLFGTAQLSQAQSPTPAEKAIQYRQAVFKVIAGNFGPLAQNAQGKLELPPGAARKYSSAWRRSPSSPATPSRISRAKARPRPSRRSGRIAPSSTNCSPT